MNKSWGHRNACVKDFMAPVCTQALEIANQGVFIHQNILKKTHNFCVNIWPIKAVLVKNQRAISLEFPRTFRSRTLFWVATLNSTQSNIKESKYILSSFSSVFWRILYYEVRFYCFETIHQYKYKSSFKVQVSLVIRSRFFPSSTRCARDPDLHRQKYWTPNFLSFFGFAKTIQLLITQKKIKAQAQNPT
jgi:hypothetical protein